MRVELRKVQKRFPLPCGAGHTTILDCVDLHVESGGHCCISGPAGSGKTILLDLVAGIARPTSGEVLLDGKPPAAHPAATVAYAMQAPVFVPELTVRENLLLPAAAAGRKVPRGRADLLLEMLELSEQFDLFPLRLSDGEQRRLGLARALLLPSRLLLVDGVFSALDAAWGEKARNMVLDAVAGSGATLVVAAREPSGAGIGAREVQMMKGKVARDVRCNH